MKNIYLANGLFSQADRDFNLKIKEAVLSSVDNVSIYLPQENGEINDKQSVAPTPKEIFEADNKFLDSSDIVIAVLDGVEIDSGVAAEIGRAAGNGSTVIGLCTDIRLNTEKDSLYRNLYVLGALDFMASDLDELVNYIKEV